MNAIVNVTPYWGIGKNGKLLVSIPTDLQRFRELTIHKTVIYGRKTLETFPGGHPLRERENIILTHDKEFTAEDAIICHDLDELKSVWCPTARRSTSPSATPSSRRTSSSPT